MKKFQCSMAPFLSLVLVLSISSCNTDSSGDGKSGTKAAQGNFILSLKAPTDISLGYSSLLGSLFTGPSPSPVNWVEVEKSGSCRLVTPKAPFCAVPCGSAAACVADSICQDYPKPISMGSIKVTGIKTKAGETSFIMNPIQNGYQTPTGTTLEFPPSSEGDMIMISATGDTAYAAFTVMVLGITPLVVLNDTLKLEDGKPLNLRWTAPGVSTAATVTVTLDISHHGGTKGAIECIAPDNGSLEISASMLGKLKALGISGFPKIDLVRKRMGMTPDNKIMLEIESAVSKGLIIPGLISCQNDSECPLNQTCQDDLRCK